MLHPSPLVFPELPSSNDWLSANGADLPDGQWVVVERQTGGHGRHGRAWEHPPGNLAASVLIRPRPAEGPPQQLSFLAGLALHEAALPWAGRLRLWLKWPNDLMLGGGKLAGVLAERHAHGVVLGFGLNVFAAPAGLPYKAAALADAVHDPPPATALLAELAPALDRWRARWREGGFAPIRTAWLARALGVGLPTTVRTGAETLRGTFAGLADDGALLLRQEGRTLTVHAGEVLG